jgi:hypothetical protein|nr:MAG TPA: hypothetical protein [Caudoviricetes sp.]
MITVKFVYNNPSDKDRILDANLQGIFLELYDEGSYKEKKQAYKLKASCGARMTPFVAVYEGDELIKAFYTEADDDVLKSLIKYLNESTSN